MKNKDLQFDRKCHVLYSKVCENEIKKSIASHFQDPKEADEIWTKVQLKYVELLKNWRTDLGGKKNFHNGKGGTYDCIAIMCYYLVCKDVVTFRQIEQIEENLILPTFSKLGFINVNKPFVKKLMYKTFLKAKSACDKWQDYKMEVAPFEDGKPIYYEFTACPAAQFAKQYGLEDIMPALCNVDYKSMELIHAKLIRKGTCVDGDKCDYTVCGDEDEYVKEHPEYVDEKGYRRNK